MEEEEDDEQVVKTSRASGGGLHGEEQQVTAAAAPSSRQLRSILRACAGCLLALCGSGGDPASDPPPLRPRPHGATAAITDTTTDVATAAAAAHRLQPEADGGSKDVVTVYKYYLRQLPYGRGY
uniref:Uncharacterized protein n=1 Tax=Oryza punctata TaxID=4537 RepID=A0A0E0LRT1_ORYPU